MTPSSDYVSMLLSFPNQPPMAILSIFFLGIMRIAPIVAFAPFLGAKLPGSTKMCLVIALTAIIFPHLIVTSTKTFGFNLQFIGFCFKELFMGMLIALLAGVPFYIAQSAGVLIDFLRGSSAFMIADPVMQTQVSPIGVLYNYVMIVLFFQIGGPFLFFDALYHSYNIIPIDGILPSAFFAANQPFWKIVRHLLTDFMAISIQLAAPSLVAILMAEMFLGIANRLAPQVQIAFLGLSIKSLLGIALLCFGWFVILQEMGKQSLLAIKSLEKILQTMRL